MNGNNTTRRGDREIISISLPVSVYENLTFICKNLNLNRSALISVAIEEYFQKRYLMLLSGNKEDQHGV